MLKNSKKQMLSILSMNVCASTFISANCQLLMYKLAFINERYR